MAETKNALPTLNKFRTSLTKGGNYAAPAQPEQIQLTVSENGKTSREAEIHIQRCANISNEWNMIAAEATVHKAKADAHRQTYEALTAEISAGTAFLNSQGAYYNFKATEARVTVQKGEMDLAIASVPVQQARQQAEYQKLRLQLEQTLLEVNKMKDETEHVRVMNALNGYNTQIALPQGIGSEVFTQTMNATPTAQTVEAQSTNQAADMLGKAKEWIDSMGNSDED